MNFSHSEEQTMLLDSFRRFLEDEIRPVANEYRDKFIPKELALELQKKLLPFGVVNGFIPEGDGGMDLDLVTFGLLMHELARVSPDICITTQIFGIAAKLMAGSPVHIKEQHLANLMSCDKVTSIGMSEPSGGSDVASIKVKARKEGDHYIINGEKTWISSGGYSDSILLLARFIEEGEDEGLGLILVERSGGYETQDIEKSALNSQSTAQVFFTDVKVPAANVVVPAPKAMQHMMKLLSSSRPIVALMALGVAQAAFDEALEFAKDRKQFGSPIAGKQLIQAKLAEMATKIEAGKLMALKALDNIDRGEDPQLQAAMSKWFGTELACEIVYDAVQIHGGSGITPEYPVEYYSRAVRIFPFTEGTTEVQKLIIGRLLTGIPAF
jgi:alkylation response protein AidB-like acyl-CoA dehydrogenase